MLYGELQRTYDDDALERFTFNRARVSGADIVVVDGLRFLKTVRMLREFDNNFFVYMSAQFDVRFQRARAGVQRADERNISRKMFQIQDMEGNERFTATLEKYADSIVINNGTKERELRHRAHEILYWLKKTGQLTYPYPFVTKTGQ